MSQLFKIHGKSTRMARPCAVQGGFTLIEIIIVITLIAFVYAVALPQFNLRTGAEAANKVNEVASSIRNAYDLAVLSGKPYRMVFMFNSGDYWLERADRDLVLLGDEKLDRDPTAEEEKVERESFEASFEEYKDLAGKIVYDANAEEEIPPVSPVVQARTALRKPVWTRVNTAEWPVRTIGPYLMIMDMQAEHHGMKQDFTDLGDEARGFLYFFPRGYVERAVIHVAYKAGELRIDEDKEPYTVITNPYEGTANVVSGYEEVDVHADIKE